MKKLYPVIILKESDELSKTIGVEGFEDCSIIFGCQENEDWHFKQNDKHDVNELFVEAIKNLFEDAKGMIKEELLNEVIALESDENCVGSMCRDGSIVFIRRDFDGDYWLYFLNELIFSKSKIGINKFVDFKKIILEMVDFRQDSQN